MKRRRFVKYGISTAGLLGLAGVGGCHRPDAGTERATSFQALCGQLLEDWCAGMRGLQIDAPRDPSRHGALACPGCPDQIHGRCMDAVYPFLTAAERTGDDRYLQAAVNVFEWSENVSKPDGSWTVVPDPNTWAGITVFGAIALGEALHHHGNLLEENRRARWTDRLAAAGDYIFRNFDLTFTNINYGFTAIYALDLLGEILDRPTYRQRAVELSGGIKNWLTEPHHLLYGEAKPSDSLSPRGLHGVDLGYNVEESLNGVVQFAVRTRDEELLRLLTTSLEGHLQFLLPDGGWDNSWGSRQYKWTYWGSRTTDGCQPAFAFLADRNPALGTAAYRSAELLHGCTHDGLLYGGLDYRTHGLPPCIHHTFCHAKTVATMLNEAERLPPVNADASLPRATAEGVTIFPEVNVWLAARGPWRATVSAYDYVYREDARQATGGSLGVLYHQAVGPLFLASMASYKEIEVFNQQPDPDGEDYALTPRVEVRREGKWYTNLYDRDATVRTEDRNGTVHLTADVSLVDETGRSPAGGPLRCRIIYAVSAGEVRITVKALVGALPRLVLPLRSPSPEKVERPRARQLTVDKPGGRVSVETDGKLAVKDTKRDRVFNMVPGIQALPIEIEPAAEEATRLTATIRVLPA